MEERLNFYEMGEIPRKNIDVMKEALRESLSASALNKGDGGKEKKKKKRKSQVQEVEGDERKRKKESMAHWSMYCVSLGF